MTTLTIKDETALGDVLHETQLHFETTSVTIADIIKNRVTTEVTAYNQRQTAHFKGFVQPTAAEKILNGYRLKKPKPIDVEKQVYVALDAFQKNGFFILVDNLQADSLTQKVEIRPTTTVSFIKLTPLVGG
ncbi:MAG: hypothetical protein AAF960_26575 [Bacteroidota bacterium]